MIVNSKISGQRGASIFAYGDLQSTDTVKCYRSKLPSDYTELSYIESTGTQWIDTGFVPNQDTRVITDIYIVKITDGCSPFYVDSGTTDNTPFGVNCWDNGWYFGYYNGYTKLNTAQIGRYIFDVNKNSFYINGELQTNRQYNYYTCDYTLPLLSWKRSGTSEFFSHIKLYNSKLYDNGQLIRNFIPCFRNFDGEVGLYDTVTESFFTNQGTGSFRMGAVINYEYNAEYDQVEYLQSSGTQYIDTGVIPNANTEFGMRVNIDYSLSSNMFVGGSRISTLTGQIGFLLDITDSGHTNTIRGNFGDMPDMYSDVNTFVPPCIVDMYHKNGTFRVDGNVYSFSPVSFSSSQYEIILFGLNTAGTKRPSPNIKCIFSIIKNNGQAQRIFIPSVRKSDSIAGMYDFVSKTFFTNAGTGTFATGSVMTYTPQEQITGVWTTKTIGGSEVSGYQFYPMKKLGWYTISARQGYKEIDQTVFVDEIKNYDVSGLKYRLYLYNNGNECTTVTGGWLTPFTSCGRGGAVLGNAESKESSYLYLSEQDNGTSTERVTGFYTNNLIDFNGFTKMSVLYNKVYYLAGTSSSAFADRFQLVALNSRGLSGSLGNSMDVKNSVGTYTFITNFNDLSSGYVTLNKGDNSVYGYSKIKVYKVWLE